MKLDILAPGSEPLAATSADPKVVSTPSPGELLGEAEGTTEVRITQGKQEQVVKVKVEPAAVESLRIGPAELTVNVGATAPIRVIGTLKGGREIDLDPAGLTWVKQPLTDKARFDRQALLVTGLAPTDEDEPLEVQYKDLTAKAGVKVQGDPKRVLLAGDFLAHPPIVTGGKTVDAAASGTDTTGTPTVVGPKVAGNDPPAVTVPATGDVPTVAPGPVVTTGPYLGKGVALRDGKLVVGDTAPDSALALAGIAPGSVVTGVNGTKLEGLAPDELAKYFATHPVVAGDELAFRTPAGKTGQAVLGDRFEAVQDVKLVGVEFNDVSAKDFAAALRLAVRESGEYRISDAQGKPLSDWQKLDAGATALLPAGKIARVADDEYELFVERKIGGQTRRFQIPFRLKAEKP